MNLRTSCGGVRREKDRGYAWLVLVASFLSHSLHFGFSFSVIGNLTVAHQKYFNIDLQKSILIGSVHLGVLLMFAPVGSILIKKFGCRVVQIFGGLCIVLGLGLSSLSTQTWHAFLLFSILSGIGTSCCASASIAILPHHFNRFKDLAFCISVLGINTGNIIWAIVSQKLLDSYGYSKAMGILSVPHIIHVLAGLTFCETDTLEGIKETVDSSTNAEISQTGAAQQFITEELITNNFAAAKRGSTKSLSSSSSEEHVDAKLSMDEEEGKEITGEVPPSNISSSILADFKNLLSSVNVWLLVISCILWQTTVSAFRIFVNDYILRSTDLSGDEVALGITLIGVTGAIGGVLMALLSLLRYNRVIAYIPLLMSYSIVTIVTVYTNSKIMFYSFTSLWGLTFAAFLANYLSVISELCEPQQLSLLFGLTLLAQGLGSLGGAPLCEYIAGQTSERYGLIAAGCSGLVASLCMVPVVVNKHRARSKQQLES